MSEYMYVSDVVDLFTFMCFKAIPRNRSARQAIPRNQRINQTHSESTEQSAPSTHPSINAINPVFRSHQVEPSTANVRPAARPRSQMIREVLDAERLFEHRAVQYTDGDEA